MSDDFPRSSITTSQARVAACAVSGRVPAPYDLYVISGGNTEDYDPSMYRRLLIEHGCLVPK